MTSSLLRVLDGARDSVSFRNKAKQLGDKVQAGDKGRDIAARKVAELAYRR